MKDKISLLPYSHCSQRILRIFTININEIEIGFLSYMEVGENIYIHQFEIDKQFQRKGLGTMTFQHLEERFTKMGKNKILIKAVDSKGFWKKMGFKGNIKNLEKKRTSGKKENEKKSKG